MQQQAPDGFFGKDKKIFFLLHDDVFPFSEKNPERSVFFLFFKSVLVFGIVLVEGFQSLLCAAASEMCEAGVLSWETVAREALQEMSEDDVADMANTCDWFDPEEL